MQTRTKGAEALADWHNYASLYDWFNCARPSPLGWKSQTIPVPSDCVDPDAGNPTFNITRCKEPS